MALNEPQFPRVLLASGSPEDERAFRAALEENRVRAELIHVSTAEAAREMASHVLPRLVIANGRLLEEKGASLIAEIRASLGEVPLPVVAIAHSPDRDQVNALYHAGANSVLVRAEGDAALTEQASMVLQYWLRRDLAATQRFDPLR